MKKLTIACTKWVVSPATLTYNSNHPPIAG